jgi:hypothetical protein
MSFGLLWGGVIKTLGKVRTPLHAGSGDGFLLQVGKPGHTIAKNLRTRQ